MSLSEVWSQALALMLSWPPISGQEFTMYAHLRCDRCADGPGVGAHVNWRCKWLSWHRIVSVLKVSAWSDKATCSCGRAYGVNHDVGWVLPWDKVRGLYGDVP